MTEQRAPDRFRPHAAEPAAKSLLAAALRRARWTILWERLWPALATLATAIGLFLALSWLGLWLWLPPLGRAVGLIGFVVASIAALVPFGLAAHAGSARRPAPARSRQRAPPSPGDRDRRRARGHRERSLFAGAVERPCRARLGRRRARSNPARRRRASPGAILMRCARWCCSPASRRFSPPAANAGSASRRRSTGRAWCCRRISASTPG